MVGWDGMLSGCIHGVLEHYVFRRYSSGCMQFMNIILNYIQITNLQIYREN